MLLIYNYHLDLQLTSASNEFPLNCLAVQPALLLRGSLSPFSLCCLQPPTDRCLALKKKSKNTARYQLNTTPNE